MHRRKFLGISLAGVFARIASAAGTRPDPPPGISAAEGQPDAPPGKIRTYYIAADEVEWDYAPGNMNGFTGKPYDGDAANFVRGGPHRIGKVYRKAVYREYTDDRFTHLKPRAPKDAYMGILGPLLQAEVGDTIRVVFKNNASRPYSMHPHGVIYDKASEGALYNDGVPAARKPGAAVPPGAVNVYTWPVPKRAGPGPNDPSSVGWLYHSHVEEMRDTDSGLAGFISVTRRGMARPDGTPKDVDREFFSMYLMYNENQSWYLEHNLNTYCGDPKGVNRHEDGPLMRGTTFITSNFKCAINGYLFCTMPMMTARRGERVRWYVATMGDFNNYHTAHWHGNTVLLNGSRTDVLSLAPAQTLTVDMAPDNPGTWLYHCHVSGHMEMGMGVYYQILA